MNSTVIPEEELCHLSFPDFEVLRFSFSANRLDCVVAGGHVEGRGVIPEPIQVTITNWAVLTIIKHDPRMGPRIQIDAEDCRLKEVCQFYFKGKSLLMAGFDCKSGLWHDLEFEGPVVTAEILHSSKG